MDDSFSLPEATEPSSSVGAAVDGSEPGMDDDNSNLRLRNPHHPWVLQWRALNPRPRYGDDIPNLMLQNPHHPWVLQWRALSPRPRNG